MDHTHKLAEHIICSAGTHICEGVNNPTLYACGCRFTSLKALACIVAFSLAQKAVGGASHINALTHVGS